MDIKSSIMHRNLGIDILRLICAFLVVFIHYPFQSGIGNDLSAICRIAVPIFFIITGFYYIDTEKKKPNNLIIKTIKIVFIIKFCLYFVEYSNCNVFS